MPQKLNALTGLRCFAAALIVASHSQPFKIPLPNYAYAQGVSLFFVLSGFILAFVYPRLDSFGEITAFYATRIARIWPAHVVALLLTAALLTGVTFNSILLANLFMVHAFVPLLPYYFSYSAPSWSISVEIGFYLVFPFLIYRWYATWWWKIPLAGCLVIGLMAFGQWLALPSLPNNNSLSLQGLLAINPLARLFEFVVGIGACSVFLWLRPRIPKLHTAVFTIVEGLVLLVVAYFIMGNPTYMFVWNVLGPGVWFDWLNHTGTFWVFAALIIVLAIGRGLISKLLSTRLLLALGEMSFSVYLIHLTIFAAYNYRGETPDYLGLSICLAITLTLAYVIWRFVEAPVRKAVKARIKAGLELTSRHEVDLVLQNGTLAMQTR